jgi:RNA polymerase sigma-70 factor (ECF subfamily)
VTPTGVARRDCYMEPQRKTEEVWQAFHERLLAFIRRRVASEHDGEDILQDVFVRIHASGQSLDELNSVSGWVHQITRHAIVDFYRARAKDDGALAAFGKEAEGETDSPPEDAEAGAELARCLEPLLDRLPAPYAEALALADLEGLPQKEAAARAGISISGMKSRVQRGRVKLKAALLDCCAVELDRRRGVIDYRRNDAEGCGDCDCE